jgi:hypothetical protein
MFQGREVAPGQVAINPHVHARESLRTPELEDAPPACLSLGGLAPVPMQDRLAEEQLGVVRIKGESLSANPQRLPRVTDHLVHAGQEREQLVGD